MEVYRIRFRSFYILCCFIVTVALVIPILLLAGPALALGWGQVASGGMDGNYHPMQHTAWSMTTFNGKLYAGTLDLETGCEIWEWDGTNPWTQVNSGGFGDLDNMGAYSMKVFNGKLYVGTRNDNSGCEIWEWDGTNPWSRVNSGGFGDLDNICASSIELFNGKLYAGTWNWSAGCEVWEWDGTNPWAQVNTDGFGDAANIFSYSMAVYGTNMYVGTRNNSSGCEVWEWDGTNPWAQVNTDGFGNADNEEAPSMAVYGANLYVGTFNENTGCEVWEWDGTNPWSQVNTDGFGNADNTDANSMAVYGTKLYVGTIERITGCEVWEWDGTNPWTQVNTNGFGDLNNHEAASMAVFDGKLYVGSHNDYTGCQVWGWDGTNPWSQVNFSGFTDNNNKASQSMELFGGKLYVGTWSSCGCQVWKYDGGVSWSQVNTSGFGDNENRQACSMSVFNGKLYVGTRNITTGCEVWEWDGINPWSQVDTDGFGDVKNIGASSMAVFNGKLYVGTWNLDTGCEVWGWDGTNPWSQANTNGFGDVANNGATSMTVYGTDLYVGTSNGTGCEVWGWDGTNPWSQVNTDGFGGVGNEDVNSMSVFNGELYAGTRNAFSGCEVWGWDGTTPWTHVNTDGFGDADNWDASSMAAFDGNLYVGTRNTIIGCQIWGWDGKTPWTHVNTDGFGDADNQDASSMAAFNGKLYVGTHNEITGCEVWRRATTAPTIISISPTEGSLGTPVTIGGTNFGGTQGTSYVTFNGVRATRYVSWSDTEIVVIVPEGAKTGPVQVVTDAGGSNTDKIFTIAPKPLGSQAWLVAEGSTGEGFDTFILMQNPNDVPAPTAVAFATEDGIVDGTLLEIPPRSRTTLRLSEYMPDQWGISTMVAAEVPIVVERSMYWNSQQTAYPYEMMSGHANLGLPAPMEPGFKMDASSDRSTDQYFPEGSTAGFDTWILLFNPMETEAQAKVTLMDETGPVVEENVTVGPLSRQTVHLNKLLPDANEIATQVTSDTFLVAERSMYWDPAASALQPYEMIGGHSTSGSPFPANSWYIAEGSTGGGFETYILLQNPQDTEAPVTALFSDATGTVAQLDTTMPAQSRSTIKVSDYVPDNFQVSTNITSGKAIVAERSMYWDKRETMEPSSMKDGHSTVGETGAAKTWMVAEGSTGGGFDTFVLITNTENTEATAAVVFMTEAGPQAPFNITIPANSRYTLWVNDYIPDDFHVSTLIEGNRDLVVERSMYWDNRVMSPSGNFPARPYECVGGHSANGLDP